MLVATFGQKFAGELRASTARSEETRVAVEFLRAGLNFAPHRHMVLAGLAIAAAPLLYLTLELPKWIVNGALGGGDFHALCNLGELAPAAALAILCVAQLVALTSLSALKYANNLLSANLGEKFLRAQRLRVMRKLRRAAPSRRGAGAAPMLTQELEAVAGFAGGMVATPVAQMVALLTVMGFLLVQDWRLALAAVALTPAQAFLAPYLMRKIGALKTERIATIRSMCAQFCEGEDPRLSGAMREARRAQDLRFDIHRRKFMMKALYNMIGHMTPLLYLSVGGWLVIEGELTVGALVAALAAYREAAGPLRELFSFYMRWADARVRYKALRPALG